MILEIYWWGGGGLFVKILLPILIIMLGWVCFFPDSLITSYSHFKYWLLDKIGQHPGKRKSKQEDMTTPRRSGTHE